MLNAVILWNGAEGKTAQVEFRWNITGAYNGHIQMPGPQDAVFNKDYPRPTCGVIEALEDLVVCVEAKITEDVKPSLPEIYIGSHAEINMIGKVYSSEEEENS